MEVIPTERIRNVALVGHGGAGKTTLAEAMLLEAGLVSRLGRVEDGTTVCDSEPEEQRRGQSLSLALAPFEWKGHKINLIDTPGYADFEGEVIAALRVVDLAVFVVNAVEGVEVQTERIWREAAELDARLRRLWERHPRFVLVPNDHSFIHKIGVGLSALQRVVSELNGRAE